MATAKQLAARRKFALYNEKRRIQETKNASRADRNPLKNLV